MILNKIRYKLAEIAPIFEPRHILTIIVLGVIAICGVMIICKINYLPMLFCCFLFIALWLNFAFKRYYKYSLFSVYFKIDSAPKGDIVEIGILAMDEQENVTHLSLKQIILFYDLDYEKTIDLIKQQYDVELIEELDIMIFAGMQFESFDQANAVMHFIHNHLKNQLKNNLPKIKTSTQHQPYDKAELKKHSRLFGIFRR